MWDEKSLFNFFFFGPEESESNMLQQTEAFPKTGGFWGLKIGLEEFLE